MVERGLKKIVSCACFLLFFHPSLAPHERAKQQINKCSCRQNMPSSVPAGMFSKWRKNIVDVMKWNAEGSQINASLKQNVCTAQLTAADW